MDISAADRDLMVRTVLGEAGNEPDEGKSAVASVILNRLKTGDYGGTASKVIMQPNAFEPWSTRRKELQSYDPKSKAYQDVAGIVDGVVSGEIPDLTNGATHFYSPSMQAVMGRRAPDWAKGQPQAQIGRHVFYAPNGPAQEDILGNWGGSTAASSAPAAAPVTEPPDLLGSWGGGAQPATTAATSSEPAPTTRITVHPQGSVQVPNQDEDLSQYTNRLLREHQGDNLSDLAIRVGAGGLRGVGDVADTLAQGIAATGGGGANLLQSAGLISPQTAQSVQDWRAGVNHNVLATRNQFDAMAANNPSASVGRVGGQIFATAPILGAGEAVLGLRALTSASPIVGTAVSGAAAGAGANALTSASSDEPLSSQLESGALAGGLLGVAGRGASAAGAGLRNLVFGHVSPETAQLADSAINKYGIPVTAGQIASNPMVRFMDSVLQRIPFTGYGARTEAQQTGLNRAIAHEMGVSSDVITPDVVRQARKNAYADYDAEKAKLAGPLSLGSQFYSDLQNVHTNAHYVLEEPLAKKVDNLLNNVVDKIDTSSHTIDADLYQSLTRKNGPLDNAINSRDSKIATYAQSIKDALENMVGRNSPVLKKLKDEADYKYFVAKSIEPLANESTTGNISPAKLSRAVDFSHTDVGELGKIGQRFMKEPPSSGTSERLLAMEMLKGGVGGALGLGGAYYFDPENFQRNAILGGAGLAGGVLASKALRSQLLTRSILNSALGRSGGGQKVSNLLARTAPLAALTYRGASPNSLASQ